VYAGPGVYAGGGSFDGVLKAFIPERSARLLATISMPETYNIPGRRVGGVTEGNGLLLGGALRCPLFDVEDLAFDAALLSPELRWFEFLLERLLLRLPRKDPLMVTGGDRLGIFKGGGELGWFKRTECSDTDMVGNCRSKRPYR
jgi:hypothetical protein